MQEYVKIRTTNPDGKTANITELCRSITWSGDYRDCARMLRFSPVISAVDKNIPQAPTDLGGSAQFWLGSNLLMDAYSLERSRDSLGQTIDVVAYDKGLYLKRNSTFRRFEKQTPEAATRALCGEFGVEVGELASTGVLLSRNFLGVNLYKIIMTMYTLAADQTSKKYRIRFRGSKLEVVEMQQSSETIILKPGCNLLTATTKESASAMTNSVAIFNDNFEQTQVVEDAEAVRLYGLMQEAIKASSTDDPVATAKKILAENGMKTTISLQCLGNTKLVTGNTVAVQEPVTGISGLFWILSDSHTWKNGIYQTKLTVDLQAIMDSQTAGSLPTE